MSVRFHEHELVCDIVEVDIVCSGRNNDIVTIGLCCIYHTGERSSLSTPADSPFVVRTELQLCL